MTKNAQSMGVCRTDTGNHTVPISLWQGADVRSNACFDVATVRDFIGLKYYARASCSYEDKDNMPSN